MTNNGVTSSFLTYCTDLAQSFSWNTHYSYTLAANGSANGFTTRQADWLGKLYTLTDKSQAEGRRAVQTMDTHSTEGQTAGYIDGRVPGRAKATK